jgi:plasmid stability protein
MAQLLVRNVPEHLVRELRTRAARNGRSAEAEHRAILEGALMATDDFKALAAGWRQRLRNHRLEDATRSIRRARDARSRRK